MRGLRTTATVGLLASLLLLPGLACSEPGGATVNGPLQDAAAPEPTPAAAAETPAQPEGTAAADPPAADRAAASSVQRPGGDWTTADPSAHGLDPEQVAAGVREIAREPGVRTLLVVAGGEIVVEESWGGASNRSRHDFKSASKSLLSALVGIDLEAGALPGLEAPLTRLLPDALPEGTSADRPPGSVTLRDLLTMSTGLASTSGEHYGAWVSTPNWTRAALAQPVTGTPGEEFVYSTGNTHLVAAVLAEAVGDDLLEHMRERLLDPLGIGTVAWERSPEGIRLGGNSFAMTPRDAARFGLLYLQEGRWGDGRVVPADWVRRSTRQHLATPPEWSERYGDYGFLWWLPRDHGGAFTAVGYGGQFIYVAPEAGVVVVMTSTLEGKGTAWDQRVLGIFRDRFAGAAG